MSDGLGVGSGGVGWVSGVGRAGGGWWGGGAGGGGVDGQPVGGGVGGGGGGGGGVLGVLWGVGGRRLVSGTGRRWRGRWRRRGRSERGSWCSWAWGGQLSVVCCPLLLEPEVVEVAFQGVAVVVVGAAAGDIGVYVGGP